MKWKRGQEKLYTEFIQEKAIVAPQLWLNDGSPRAHKIFWEGKAGSGERAKVFG